jgi:Protein of unknown function (DUF2891)
MPHALTQDVAASFARVALGHVSREIPNQLSHTLSGPQDARTPRELHPLFYGSYDWHSCVHAYWMLARLLRLYPGMSPATEIRALFESQITEENVAGECDYLHRPLARGFERPYGWAWLLKLAEALLHLPDARWSANLAPLAAIIVDRFTEFLPKSAYPVRVGTHFNTAFALALAADYASATRDVLFADLLQSTAEKWYSSDADCHAWEPSGDDFLSSALVEAECMRRLMPAQRFTNWFERFLPRLGEERPASLFVPAVVADRSDGKIAHLDGLNLSRAWCWRSLAAHLPRSDVHRTIMERAAHTHLDAGLPHVVGDYVGEHWLASFAVLALDG